jgi:hypothetical protein
MDVEDILDRSRLALADPATGTPRWPDPTLIIYINDAVRATIQARPDLQLDSTDTLKNITDVASNADTIDLPDVFIEALADYVAFKALSEDEADKANADKAELRYAAYQKILYGA